MAMPIFGKGSSNGGTGGSTGGRSVRKPSCRLEPTRIITGDVQRDRLALSGAPRPEIPGARLFATPPLCGHRREADRKVGSAWSADVHRATASTTSCRRTPQMAGASRRCGRRRRRGGRRCSGGRAGAATSEGKDETTVTAASAARAHEGLSHRRLVTPRREAAMARAHGRSRTSRTLARSSSRENGLARKSPENSSSLPPA